MAVMECIGCGQATFIAGDLPVCASCLTPDDVPQDEVDTFGLFAYTPEQLVMEGLTR